MMKRQRIVLFLVVCWLSSVALARGIYQEPEDFLAEVFAGSPPAPQVVWLTGEVGDRVKRVLGHEYGSLRVRYWLKGARSAWVLEAIGKEQPITVGIVVDDDRIELLKVLIFRESRGWEVRHPFFTKQFIGASLGTDLTLDRHIDGITGATLSVRALTKLSRMALFLHQEVNRAHDSP